MTRAQHGREEREVKLNMKSPYDADRCSQAGHRHWRGARRRPRGERKPTAGSGSAEYLGGVLEDALGDAWRQQQHEQEVAKVDRRTDRLATVHGVE